METNPSDTPVPEGRALRLSHGLTATAMVMLGTVLPLAMSPDVLHPYSSPKMLALALAVAATSIAVGLRAVGGEYTFGRHNRVVLLLLVSLAVAGTASLLASPTLGLSFWGTPFQETGYFVTALALLILPLGLLASDALKRTPRLRWYLLLPVLPVVALVLLHGLGADLPYLLSKGDRAKSTLGNPIHVGGYLGALTVFAVVSSRQSPMRYRAASYLLALTCLIGLITSGTRGAVLGVLVAAALGLLLRLEDPGSAERRTTIRASLGAPGFLLSGALAVALAASFAFRSSANHILELAPGTWGMRVEAWRIGLAAIPDSLLVGTGPSTFRQVYLDGLTGPLVSEYYLRDELLFADAHSWILEYATTYGGLFAVLLVALCAYPLTRRRAWTATARGAYLGAIVLLVNYLFSPVSITTLPLVFFFIGLSLADSHETHQRREPGTCRRGQAFQAATLGTAALAAVAFVGLATSYTVTDYSVRQAYLQGDGRAALAAAQRLRPAHPAPYQVAGQTLAFDAAFLDHRGAERRMEESFARAVALDPSDPATFIYWGQSRQLVGNHEGALEAFSLAEDLVPDWPIAIKAGAYSLASLGDEAEARRRVEQVVDSYPGDLDAARLLAEISATD